jgi:hypothetical protein
MPPWAALGMVAALCKGLSLLPRQGIAVLYSAELDPFGFRRVMHSGPHLHLSQQDRYISRDAIEEAALHLLREHIAVAAARYNRGGMKRSTQLGHMKTGR